MKKMIKKQQETNLVFMNNGSAFCDSRMIAEKFEVQHAKVLRVVERIEIKNDKAEGDKLSPSMREFDPVFLRYDDEYHGQKFTAYRMNKTAFMLVAMRFTTAAAFIWQRKFASAFSMMEKTIAQMVVNRANAEWVASRQSGKLVRREETDTIKAFVAYAKSQGSQNAERYYCIISKMENQALFMFDQKYKNIREILDIGQMSILRTADKIVEKAITEGMEHGLHYKEIYCLAKDRIELLAAMHGKGRIPAADGFRARLAA